MSRCCNRGCRKCFPNGCCGFCKPPPQIQQQQETVTELKKHVQQKDTPYGYIFFYPGVHSSEDKYTCPMLSVHLYRHSQHQANSAQANRTVIVHGKNQQFTQQGPQTVKVENRTTAEEEIIMIPVEDVVSLGSKLEIKKGLQADVKSETKATHDFRKNCWDDCWNSTKNWCENTCGCCQTANKIAPFVRNQTTLYDDPNRNTKVVETEEPIPPTEDKCTNCDCCRCWCCKKQILVRLIKRTFIKQEKEAQRVITMTIEYSKYSNLDTPSHTRLLNDQHQSAYYKEKFGPETKLQFYLVNNTEFDPANFELKKAEAETLCRTVMQLKAMKDHYPSERELDGILNLAYKRTFGDFYTEPTLHIPEAAPSSIAIQSSRSTQPTPRPAIEQQLNSTTNQRDVVETSVRKENRNEEAD